MWRNLLKASLALNLYDLRSTISSFDNPSAETATEKNANIALVKRHSGWDRLKIMFEIDDFGNPSKEVITVLHTGAMSLFVGAMYGGVMSSRTAYMDFIRNNQATKFNDHMEAKKKLQDKVTLSFGKGAFKWAWRLSLFSSSFVGISTTISVYRGKSGIIEYVIAGGLSGALYKFNMGPRGWIVGGALGTGLGLVAGCVTSAMLSLTGLSIDEVRYWQYHWRHDRNMYIQKGMSDYLSKEEGALYNMHTDKTGKKGIDDIAETSADAPQ